MCYNMFKTSFIYVYSHSSKFRSTVKDEYKSGKASYKTMGPAKVETRAPQNFVKKHEKEPKLPDSKLFLREI